MSDFDSSRPVPEIAPTAAFAGGIFSPAMRYRSDMQKWKTGAAEITNMFVHVQGGASNRPGTQYIGTCKQTNYPPKLVPFIYNSTQAYILEFGAGYIRIINDGAYLTNADGSAFEVETPYGIGDVFNLRYVQSADVMTITHPSYAPRNLNRLGTLDWTLTEITFEAGISAPTVSSSSAINGNAGNTGTTPGISQVTYTYCLTAASISSNTESNASASFDIKNYNISYWSEYGNYNTMEWAAITDADYYNVYRYYQGSYGLVGSTTSLSFSDEDYEPDTTTAPPTHYSPLDDNYPSCIAYYQQRRVFAGSIANPQTVWMTRSGNYSNMDVANPVKDDDAITATVVSNQVNQIKHIVMMADLLVFTSGSVWKISSGSATGTAITPSNFTVVPQMFVGSSDVKPITVNYDVLFIESKGSHVRDLQYDYYAAVYTGNDLSVYADHLFYGYTISDWAFSQFPFNLVWAIRSDGTLLGLTYLKEQNIWAWHQHSTSGSFQSVAVVPETTDYGVIEDMVYFVVERVINGSTVFYVERLHTRQLGTANADLTTAWFVDCGLRYTGAAVSVVSGLEHLEGQTVSACIDGKGYVGLSVNDGAVTLPESGTSIVVGLPYTAHLQTLPLELGETPQFSRRKRISKIFASIYNTCGLSVSLDNGSTTRPLGNGPTAGAMSNDIHYAVPPASWDLYGQVDFYQNYPLPCTVTGISLDVEEGN